MTPNSYWHFGGGDEIVLKLIVMIAQLCEYTKNRWTVHLKWVNCMACEFYLNQAVS